MKKIERRGQIIRKADDCYLVRVYLGRDATGKRRLLSKQVRGTHRQADQALTRLLAEKDKGTLRAPSGQTIGALLSSWLTSKLAVAQRTRESYQQIMDTYITPALGTVRAEKLTPLHIQQAYADMKERGLSTRTVRLAHAVLRQALQYAVLQGFLFRNPADLVELPKKDHREMKCLSPQQLVALLDWAEEYGREHYALWCLLLLGGLRPQEALALQWEDLQGSTLMVRRALSLEGGKPVVRPTKTTKSTRPLQLPERAVAALSVHRGRQAREMVEEGYRTPYIFTTKTGTFHDHRNVRRWWHTALQRAGLPEVRLYDARHSHATFLLDLGEHPKVAAERLGHSSTTLFMETYSHVIPSMQAQTVARMEQALASPKIALG